MLKRLIIILSVCVFSSFCLDRLGRKNSFKRETRGSHCQSSKFFIPETLAAREIRRYLYLRSGALVSIKQMKSQKKDLIPRYKISDSGDLIPAAYGDPFAPGIDLIAIGNKDRAFADEFNAPPSVKESIAALKPQQYRIVTIQSGDRNVLLIAGGDGAGTLYGAYRFAERIGARFYMHGDVIPDKQMELTLPLLDETAAPLFELRGLHPFHDFPEGPDWWNIDEYKAILSQIPKMGMNFSLFIHILKNTPTPNQQLGSVCHKT